ncbi:MAG TPA: PHB depolymerase family esterase [Actinospica sp.]|nr:PHB depolymerase family esterase [Actinospica sp.]
MQPTSFARHRLARASTAVAVVLAVIAALVLALGVQRPAQANTAALTQVTGFGANPGKLGMFDYVPTTAASDAPLVIALHGCTQQAADYYNDSGWPKYADLWGFDIVFPQQNSTNDSEDCFDWFTASDDSRGQGEAESIIQMVDYMEAHYSINPSRVYVTGLSAGGGMTADLLADYPDVFASGSIDSGLPAQCATSQTQAYTCMDGSVNDSVAQWTSLATDSDPGYKGTWPTVQIWQGTADYTVSTANSTELMDQWTGVWGIGQTASSTASLSGGTSESIYDNAQGKPVVEVFAISGMGHGLAVSPGSAANQCGSTGAYFLNYICSTYYTAVYWGLNNGSTTSPTASATPTKTTASPTPTQTTGSPTPTKTTGSPSPTATGTPLSNCWTTDNVSQNLAGRSYFVGTESYAIGSNNAMGAYSSTVTSSLWEPTPGYWEVVAHC